jgi:hypothetical protein
MSEDLQVDRDRQHPPDDADATAVRPGLADDLLAPSAVPDDGPGGPVDDGLDDDELLVPGGQRPSRVTRFLLALLICAVGVFVGVQVARFAGVPASGAAGGASGQSRRFGPPGAGATGGGTAAARPTAGSSAPAATGQVSAVKAHTLVVVDQGTRRTVTFTDDTTVTTTYGHGALGVGDAVTVFGSRAADGSVNATSIVVR